MPIPHKQIKNLMKSNMYQDNNNPLHDQVCRVTGTWFQNYADKLDENNELKESAENKNICFKPGYLDDEIIRRNIPEIKHHEGVKNFAYKDTKGIVTAGAGLNVDNFDKYNGLNWIHLDTGQKATPEEIKADYQYIKNAPYGNYHADYYKNYTTFRLSDDDIDKQMTGHLKNDLGQIRKTIPIFDGLPAALQDVIMDIQYNTGHIERFPKFIQAIYNKDVRGMVEESHRKDVPENRNQAMAKKILQNEDWEY